eukprot:TRINITY_DN437_c0_g1_i27.p1 TRINITY_DN437_c0_g1~~TRINITY_DN437_c0_g1_i27.p1  ORF type:complete len:405 (-),score=70.09 TRINITY_DN437_c0_g1_i27:57-1271(-)
MELIAKFAETEYKNKKPLNSEQCWECFSWKIRYERQTSPSKWVEQKKAQETESKALIAGLIEKNQKLEAALSSIEEELKNTKKEREDMISEVQKNIKNIEKQAESIQKVQKNIEKQAENTNKTISIVQENIENIEKQAENTNKMISLVQINRTFKSSFYKYWYNEQAKIIFSQQDLESHVRKVVRTYRERNSLSITADEAECFCQNLIDEVIQQDSPNVPKMCKDLWRSMIALKEKEFCSILNEFLRIDLWEIMESVAYIARGINDSYVVPAQSRFDQQPEQQTLYLYRVSTVPKNERNFFQVDKVYRCPMFLATSRKSNVAEAFTQRAEAIGATRFIISNTALFHGHRTLSTTYEKEHLFPPYSVFQVTSVSWKDKGPDLSEVHLTALDNLSAMEELPISTWH